jgi:hypothetical protein
MRPLLLLALLAAPAFAAEPLHALIFAGGATEADAKAALAAFKAKLENQLDNVVKLAPGEPRIVESAKLPGLKPGFHIVTLGLCKTPGPALAAIKALYPGAYTKPLTGEAGPERCPTLVEGTSAVGVEPPVKVGPLVVTAFVTREDTKDERGRETPTSWAGFVLTEKSTGLVKDLITLEGDIADRVGDGPAGWEYETCTANLAPDKNGFTLTRTCTNERTGCERGEKFIPKAWSDVTKVTVVGDMLAAGEAKKSVSQKSACR